MTCSISSVAAHPVAAVSWQSSPSLLGLRGHLGRTDIKPREDANGYHSMNVFLQKPRIQIGDFVIRHEMIELLRAVGTHSSISAAAKERGMEFRRAWGFVQALNETLKRPVVQVVSMRGRGRGGRGSVLTPLGAALIEQFDKIESACELATRSEIAEMERRILATARRRDAAC